MALNSSGPISLAGTTTGQSIEIENGGNGTTQISLNDTAVRTLAGVASGAITMPTDFYGKSNRAALAVTYSSNTTNASIAIGSIGGYVAGKSDVTVTIDSGVYVYSTSTGTPGLTITGGTTGDTLTIVNNGFILGQGGTGGVSPYPYTGKPGGPALSIGFNATINNTNASAYIAGGGGGGGSGVLAAGGGGGAGGGTGAIGGGGQAGGTGGGPGSAGGNGVAQSSAAGGSGGGAGGGSGGTYESGKTQLYGGGGGGGRILPGTGGASGGGTGGGGGAGGAGNSAGGNRIYANSPGGGGGWGAVGGTGYQASTGGAGGKAVNLNGKTVTWVSGNTTRVYGAVS